jgi:hypothetical protein
MKDHTQSSSYKLLVKCSAPAEVKAQLLALLRINDSLPTELQSSERDLLIDACKVANFTRPFENDGRKRSFRARLLPEKHPDFRDDVGSSFVTTSRNTPGEEQSYRRGYDQGFSAALSALDAGEKAETLDERAKEIHRWRTEQIQIIGTLPGDKEEISIGLLFRRLSISLKQRYSVLKRDKFRCRICGNSADNGATLEIDHVVPVAKGGTNDFANLQTLCFECNRGKSDF